MSLAGLRWLLPAALYGAAGLSERVQDARATHREYVARDWPVLDGPASRALDSLLRTVLPRGLVHCRSEDYGDPAEVAATVLYRGPNGGHVRVMRRRLTRPLLLDALADPSHDGFVRIRPTGTDVLRRDDDTADTHRLAMVRPNGTLLIIESIGMPAAGARAPLSSDQLDDLACTLDDPSSDIGRNRDEVPSQLDDQSVAVIEHGRAERGAR
jgi:hypothetical protein